MASLRDLEPPLRPAFLFQISLVLIGSWSAFLLLGWWFCAVWSVAYVGLQFLEKAVVRIAPAKPSTLAFSLVLVVLFLEASVFCAMPLYFWFLGPDLGKFGALALVTASTMHTMHNRATFPSILLCFLLPDAGVFAAIAASSSLAAQTQEEAAIYLLAGAIIISFFLMMFFQVYQKEIAHLREVQRRQKAQEAERANKLKFESLFDAAPIPIREEDLSGMKHMIDGLGISDETSFHSYLDDHPEFVAACGQRIKVLDANRASLEQHGYTSKSEMLAKVVGTLSPAALKIVRTTIEAIYRGEKGRSYETTVTRADSDRRIVAAKWSVVPGHEADYSRILLCSLDITKNREAEDALRQSQKMETVGQLTAGIAHDFNNLLAVIIGNLQLIQLEQTRAEIDHFVMEAEAAAQRGAELTRRLLSFGRKAQLNPKLVDLNCLIEGMAPLIRRTLTSAVQVELSLASEPLMVSIDASQFESALLNLAVNARDAMEGSGTLTIQSAVLKSRGERSTFVRNRKYEEVLVSVSDTGAGIPKELMDRVFEPFFTTKPVGEGSGLGLAMVYGFVQQTGGDIEIFSELGVGTTFKLFFSNQGS